MKIITSNGKIRCDITGCDNLADVFIAKSDKCYVKDSLKLCNTCANELLSALKKRYKTVGDKNAKKERN